MTAKTPGKRAFVALLLLAGVLLLVVLAVLYVVPYYGLGNIHPRLPLIMGILTGALGAGVVLVVAVLTTATLLGRDVPCSTTMRGLVSRVLLPALVFLGRLAGLGREEVQHAFVAVNNELVMARCKNGHPPSRILLLMPHCLQDKDCDIKVTHRVDKCKRCGKCPVKDLLGLSEKYNVHLAIATGGTLARKIVMDARPDLIIAVACERDLTSGIKDTSPLPVYGIFNERPFGPCVNTRVAIDRVESVLREVASLRNP